MSQSSLVQLFLILARLIYFFVHCNHLRRGLHIVECFIFGNICLKPHIFENMFIEINGDALLDGGVGISIHLRMGLSSVELHEFYFEFVMGFRSK